MAMNIFKIRKLAALIVMPILVVTSWYIGMIIYNFWISLIFLGGGLIITVPLGFLLLKNPFSQMVEGKGILCLNMDSPGIITPTVLALHSPYLKGKMNNQNIEGVFDREAVFHLANPTKNKSKAVIEENHFKFNLDSTELNQARFGLFHYPVLIYNAQLKTFLTKDFFSDVEKDSFSEHGVLYLNRKMEELTSAVRDFGRHVVELTKPSQSIFKNKWVIIVIVILIGILILMFAPVIINSIKTFMGSNAVAQGLSEARQTVTRV